jgi:hypothetical protein
VFKCEDHVSNYVLLKYLRGYKIILILNIKTDQFLCNTTGNYLALEDTFLLRINRPGKEETAKQDFESLKAKMR